MDFPCFLGSTYFRPDGLFAFDKICYLIQLEILEEGRKQHSLARHIPDEDRELEIRDVFALIPMGFLYVSMAHNRHLTAHPDDVFFRRAHNSEGFTSLLSSK